jgi:acyl carrier protein
MSTLDQLKKIIAKVTHGSEGDIAMNMPLKAIKADSLHWVQIIIAVEGDLQCRSRCGQHEAVRHDRGLREVYR